MRNVLGWIGRVLLTSGILLLLFVAYQLWGTGIYQSRQQDALNRQFLEKLDQHGGTPATTKPSSTATTSSAPTTTRAPAIIPPNGDAVASIDIKKIGVSQIVVEGVDVPDLRKAPGHYSVTPPPGEEGNAAIAGHRTTYGAPFGDLDQLAPGDEIVVTTVEGVFTFKVTDQGPFVVNPNDGSVLQPMADPNRPGHALATLTLTTCNPKYSAAERLIVQANLVLSPGEVPLPASAANPSHVAGTINGLEGDSGSRFPALLWGLIAALVGGLWWFLFHRYKRWYVWIVGAIPFLVVLFVFYTYLERLLPSNY